MSLGKKFLSAFVEVDDSKKPEPEPAKAVQAQPAVIYGSPLPASQPVSADTAKFKDYFDKLFNEANLPGPDYYEYSKMLEAMQAVPDERVRFITAFAGLSVQGLDKTKLVATAEQYIKLLNDDNVAFNNKVSAALQEKVVEKKQQITAIEAKIQEITQEITKLQEQRVTLQGEVNENEAKIAANTGGYTIESEAMKAKIANNIEKIKTFIQ